MKYLLITLAAGAAFIIWLFGIGYYRIDIDKSAYWPDLGYGVNKIYIWHNGEIIYNEDSRYYLKDLSDSVSTKQAKDFIELYKRSH